MKKIWNDRRGLASVEATIMLATLGIALAAAGYVVGPAVKAYSDRLAGAVHEARCLAKGDPAQDFPTCSQSAP